jgi:PAS domain S-box-containing protein
MNVDLSRDPQCSCAGGNSFDPRVCQAILRTIDALVIVLDPSGRILAFNRACEDLTGYTFHEVRGAGFMELLIPPEDRDGVRQVFALLSEGRLPANHENEWLTRRGGRRLIRWTNTIVPGADGKAAYVIGTGLDITDHVAAEKALREAEHALESYRGAEDGGTLESLRRLLRALGFRVEVFDRAGPCLEYCLEQAPDRLILDLHMPGQGGLELADALKAAGVDAPIIFISADETGQERTRAVPGVVAFLQKPFEREALLAALTKAAA